MDEIQKRQSSSASLKLIFMDDSQGSFSVSYEEGWRIDNPSNMIIVGKGSGRYHIPLCNVKFFQVEYKP